MKRIIIIASAATIILVGVILFMTTRYDKPERTTKKQSTYTNTYSVTLPEELREIIDESRSLAFPMPNPDIENIIKGYHTSDFDAEADVAIAEYLKQSNQEERTPPEYLSHEEIASEIDYLFDLLKYGYGAYQYFGGDEVYGAVKQLMLKKLSLMSDPISNDSYVNDLLIPCIKTVIEDNHFWLGTQSLGTGNQLYLNEELIIRKEDSDYITVMDGRTYRILRVGQQMEGIMPTLTRDGEFAWVFGYMLTSDKRMEQLKIDVELEDVETQEKSSHMIPVFPVSKQYLASLSQELYAIKEVDGITVFENRRLFERENDPSLEEFVSTGYTLRLRKEPVLIIDLRCNQGGNDGFAFQWIQSYTGRQPSNVMFFPSQIYSVTANQINQGVGAQSPPTWWYHFGYRKPNFIPNDSLVIVLMDNAIGSSGESFIGFLRHLDNVVFVGTNTMGCLVTGNVGIGVLPNSKQMISFGTKLNIRPDLSQFEGVGFMPDLWVPPGESLERVIKFVKRYKTVD